MPRIYVIHENDAWVEPLRGAFAELRLPFTEWFIAEGKLDLDRAPPQGVFYNRMSASSHTRGHRYAPELTGGVLAWLESHGRRVVNNGRALQLEISKIAQYAALARYGIKVPRTIAAVGRDAIVDAAKAMRHCRPATRRTSCTRRTSGTASSAIGACRPEVCWILRDHDATGTRFRARPPPASRRPAGERQPGDVARFASRRARAGRKFFPRPG